MQVGLINQWFQRIGFIPPATISSGLTQRTLGKVYRKPVRLTVSNHPNINRGKEVKHFFYEKKLHYIQKRRGAYVAFTVYIYIHICVYINFIHMIMSAAHLARCSTCFGRSDLTGKIDKSFSGFGKVPSSHSSWVWILVPCNMCVCSNIGYP